MQAHRLPLHHSQMHLLSSSVVLLHLRRWTVSASLHVSKSCASIFRYLRYSLQPWSGIWDVCIIEKEIVVVAVNAQKTLDSAAGESSSLENKQSSPVSTKRNRSRRNQMQLWAQMYLVKLIRFKSRVVLTQNLPFLSSRIDVHLYKWTHHWQGVNQWGICQQEVSLLKMSTLQLSKSSSQLCSLLS